MITVTGLTKHYGDRVVVDEMTFDIAAGRAIEPASSAEVFDNSGAGPKTIAAFVDGGSVGAPRWPEWMSRALTDRWPS